MKTMVVSDIHGNHEALQNAFDKFTKEGYDKIVLLGDLADSYTRTNEDILKCFYIARDFKELYPDKMEWLLGNHDVGYIWAGNMCSGYRGDLARVLNPWLDINLSLFNIAYQYGNHLFTHAGVQRKWLEKHQSVLESVGYQPGNIDTLGTSLNNLLRTHSRERLFEVGVKRGGLRGDYGGPTWCDKTEMESYGPVKGFHQYVGHTPVPYIHRIDKFEGDKHYNNTSVTFCDVLQTKEQFLTLEL